MPTTDLKAVELRLRAILDPFREHLVEDELDVLDGVRHAPAEQLAVGPALAGREQVARPDEVFEDGPVQPEPRPQEAAIVPGDRVGRVEANGLVQVDETVLDAPGPQAGPTTPRVTPVAL